jgi:hypothetical protein
MKSFNKITAYLIIASFLFSGEAFSRNSKGEDEKRALTVRPKVTKTRSASLYATEKRRAAASPHTKATALNVTERAKVTAKAKAKSIPIKAEERKKPASPPRTKSAPLNAADKKKLLTVPKAKAQPASKAKTNSTALNVTERAKVTAKAKAKSVPIKPEERKRPASPPRAKSAPLNAVEKKKLLTVPKVKAQPASKTKAKSVPIKAEERKRAASPSRTKSAPLNAAEKKKLLTAPKTKTKFAPLKKPDTVPHEYVINLLDLPANLRAHIKPFGMDLTDLLKSLGEYAKKLSIKITLNSQELRKVLTAIQKMENRARGMTQKARNCWVANGYNPASNKDFKIKSNAIPLDLKEYLEDLDLEDDLGFDLDFDVMPELSFTNVGATHLLNKIQESETSIQGLTKNTRTFLKLRYGFQG